MKRISIEPRLTGKVTIGSESHIQNDARQYKDRTRVLTFSVYTDRGDNESGDFIATFATPLEACRYCQFKDWQITYIDADAEENLPDGDIPF